MILLVAERVNNASVTNAQEWERRAREDPLRWLVLSKRLGAFRGEREPSNMHPMDFAAARRLRDVGLRWDTSINLLPPHHKCGAWDPSLAWDVAQALEAHLERGGWPEVSAVVLCGRRVMDAFGMEESEFGDSTGYTSGILRPPGGDNVRIFCAPHPSGRNRFWNDPAEVARVRRALLLWQGCSLDNKGTS